MRKEVGVDDGGGGKVVGGGVCNGETEDKMYSKSIDQLIN